MRRSTPLPSWSPVTLDSLRAALGSGVVAPYELALGPVPWLTAGTLTWPWEHAHHVMHAWRGWTAGQPESVTTAARIVRVPHLAGMAPALRGRSFVAVDVAILGEPWGAPARLAALRRLDPEVDTVAIVSAAELLGRRDGVAAAGARVIGESMRLGALPAAAIDAFVAAAGPASGTDLVSVGLRHVGGGEFALVGIGVAVDEDQAERLRVGVEQLVRRLEPWAAAA